MTKSSIAANQSGNAHDKDPQIIEINKRIRAINKKMNKIERLEGTLQSGQALSKEQKQAVTSKPTLSAILEELEKLRENQIRSLSLSVSTVSSADIEDSTQSAPRSPESVPSRTTVENTEENPEFQTLTDLLSLLHVGHLLSPNMPGNFGLRASFIENVGSSPRDLDAILYLMALVDGSGTAFSLSSTPVSRVRESEGHARSYLSRSQENFLPAFSYYRAHDMVDMFLDLNVARRR